MIASVTTSHSRLRYNWGGTVETISPHDPWCSVCQSVCLLGDEKSIDSKINHSSASGMLQCPCHYSCLQLIWQSLGDQYVSHHLPCCLQELTLLWDQQARPVEWRLCVWLAWELQFSSLLLLWLLISGPTCPLTMKTLSYPFLIDQFLVLQVIGELGHNLPWIRWKTQLGFFYGDVTL